MRRGLTLIEVLIVLTVISVLIGLATPRIKGFQDQAKIQKAQAGLKTLQTAIEAYYMRHNAYPPQSDNVSTDYLMGEANLMINDVLYDPFGAASTTEYQYLVSNDGRTYVLFSVGLDRVNDTAQVMSGTPFGGDDIVVTNGTIRALDLETDENNCGEVGVVCAENEVCTDGACA